MMYRDAGLKRAFDLLIGVAGLVVFGVFIIAGYLAVLLTSKGPVFFLQTRVGRNGQPFQIYKLRTMRINPARTVNQTTNTDPEVLPVGRILRRLKIDEMPQMLNVISGDMSLVGPRPCLEQTLAEMPEWARERFQVRPGVTGLAQVNGNIALTWEERWRHDVHYVRACSFSLDLLVIMKTVLVVMTGEERFRRIR